ncbi:MAG: FtsQ-type POTRA domain-containing protein, partial [Cyanobacteria bacterium J06623_7]
MSVFPPPQLQYKLATISIQQRRAARLALWRACLIIGGTLSLGVIATVPNSQIKTKQQIDIAGETLVSEAAVHRAMNLAYPQFIWSIDGISLAHKIESIPSIATARVSRQIIPPTIEITIREKTPVALATSQGKVGFLNAEGEWIEQSFYDNLNTKSPLPELKVIDYKTQFQHAWTQVYRLILLYPELKISEVRWQSGGNIYLETKIGQVFIGSQLSRLP